MDPLKEPYHVRLHAAAVSAIAGVAPGPHAAVGAERCEGPLSCHECARLADRGNSGLSAFQSLHGTLIGTASIIGILHLPETLDL